MGLPAGIFLVTLALWLPRLQQIPWFTDDLSEAYYAQFSILAESGWPLHALYPGYGSFLFPYSLGAFMAVFGPSAELPRLFVAMANAGGGVALYFLGTSQGNRMAGLSAALLLTVSPEFRLSYSYSWGICLLPPLVIATAWAYTAWHKKPRLRTSLLVGVMAGLTLLAHPVGLFFLAGLAFHWVVFAGRRSGWRQAMASGAIAVVAFVIVYSPAVWGGAIGAESISWFVEQHPLGNQLLYSDFQSRLVSFPGALAWVARAFAGDRSASLVGIETPIGVASAVILFCLVVLGAMSGWQRNHTIAIPSLATALLVAVGLPQPPLRYFAYLLPFAFLLVGWALWSGSALWRRLAGGTATVILAVILFWQLEAVYSQIEQQGVTNDFLWEDTTLLASENSLMVYDIYIRAQPDSPPRHTCGLSPRFWSAGSMGALLYLLSLNGTPRETAAPNWNDLPRKLPGKSLVFLTDAARDNLGDPVLTWETVVKRRCYGIYRPNG